MNFFRLLMSNLPLLDFWFMFCKWSLFNRIAAPVRLVRKPLAALSHFFLHH